MFIGEEKGLQNLNQILKEMEKRGWNLFFLKTKVLSFLTLNMASLRYLFCDS